MYSPFPFFFRPAALQKTQAGRLLLALLPLSLLVILDFSVAATKLHAEEVLIPIGKLAGGGDGKFFLLAVGVGNFKDSFWPKLKWAKSDAERVAASLGVDTELTVQTQRLTDEGATRAKVLGAMRSIRDRATARDTVVVYFSSHGTLAEGPSGDLEKLVVLNDTNEEDPIGTGLAHRDIEAWLDSLPARHKLLIFATCHAGIGKSRLSPRVEQLMSGAKGKLVPLADVSEGALILAAAAKGEAAREDDRLGGDIYTHYFLEGLAINDRNKDGVVTALEAHDYAKERTYSATGGRQRPTAEARLIGDADVPLRGVRKRRGLPLLEAYDKDLAGFELQVDAGVKGRLPLAFPLAEGSSKVSLYAPVSGVKLADYEVHAKNGETVTLGELLAPPPYEFGLETGTALWADGALRRLADKQNLLYNAAFFNYHWYELYGGVRAELTHNASSTPRPGLGAKFSHQAIGATVGYTRNFARWRLFGEAGVASEKAVATLTDSSGDSLSYDAGATLLSLAIGGGYDLRRGFLLSAHLGRRSGQFAFGDLGNLSGSRTQYGLGLSYAFGGVARRL